MEINENLSKPDYAEIETKARALVYRAMKAELVKGNTASPEQIEGMVRRVIRDMGY